jgi:arginine decarboxylase
VIPELTLSVTSSDYNSQIVTELEACIVSLKQGTRRAVEIYYHSKMYFNIAQDLYVNGTIHLKERAQIERLYYKICLKVLKLLDPKIHNHRVLFDVLNEDMANKIFCNFSLFQSMPDIWGIEQVFPILPLSNLDQLANNDIDSSENNLRGLLQDMTCDSDGRIEKYIDGQGLENSLRLPKFDEDKPYNIGFFMVGAYQEILGDLHNLFGDTATLDVRVNTATEQGFEIFNQKSGDSIVNVLKYVDYNPDILLTDLLQKYEHLSDNQQQYSEFCNFLSGFINSTPYYNN